VRNGTGSIFGWGHGLRLRQPWYNADREIVALLYCLTGQSRISGDNGCYRRGLLQIPGLNNIRHRQRR
jgi:hypothetical protein